MALLTRNYGNFQAVLFFVLCECNTYFVTKNRLVLILVLLVYFSESINEIASSNWHVFSRQQYFDSKGLFISIVFSMPILLNCMLMVVGMSSLSSCCDYVWSVFQGSWLYQSTQLMKNLKRAQLRAEIKRRESQKEEKVD